VQRILQGYVNEYKAEGIIEIDDPNFGNLWSNIRSELLFQNGFSYGDLVKVTIHHQGEKVYQEAIPFAHSFGYVRQGEAVLYTNELMKASMALCKGDFKERYRLGYGEDWIITLERVN
jgi:S-adenosylmethionine hydrolase